MDILLGAFFIEKGIPPYLADFWTLHGPLHTCSMGGFAEADVYSVAAGSAALRGGRGDGAAKPFMVV